MLSLVAQSSFEWDLALSCRLRHVTYSETRSTARQMTYSIALNI